MKLNPIATFAALSVLFGAAAHADSAVSFQSDVRQTPLIELYTSEGCSSCPPAERWFTEIGQYNGLWTDYVPVAFHVTYWNYLGWRDELSDVAYDQRQRRRAAGADSGVYTPGVFRDGDEFRQWRGVRGAPKKLGADDVGQLTISVEGQRVVASFDATAPAEDLRLELAVLSSGINSDVKAGENRGRSLRHDFVVVDLRDQPLKREGDRWQAQLALPDIEQVSRPALAAWVVDASGQPLQATGGWLTGASGK